MIGKIVCTYANVSWSCSGASIADNLLMIEEANFYIKGDRNMQNYHCW
jgi:hypothetical protein